MYSLNTLVFAVTISNIVIGASSQGMLSCPVLPQSFVCPLWQYCMSLVAVLYVSCGSTVCPLWQYCMSLVAVLYVPCGSTVCPLWQYCMSLVAVLCGSTVCPLWQYCMSLVAVLYVPCGSTVCPLWQYCIYTVYLHVHMYPFDVLLVPLVEVDDPVAQALESGRGQCSPDGWQLTIVEGLSHFV